MDKIEEHVKKLAEKAANCPLSEDAVRFSQAASNLAHAEYTMRELPPPKYPFDQSAKNDA
jgi:hypothetical protein